MSQQVQQPGRGDGDDGVVYLGRNSFKMKVGAQMTPPAGTPAARPAAAPPPAARTPSPSVITPRPVALSYRPLPRGHAAQAGAAAGGGAKNRVLVAGLCMIAFSCGVMTTVAVDRLWPRARAQCVGHQATGVGLVR